MENKLEDIVQTIVLKASIQKVWDRISTSEGIASWFMPNDFVLEQGREFHIQSPFGPSPCKVTEVDPPYRLSFNWDTDGWFVTFDLKELDEGQTQFTLIHGGWKEQSDIISKANEKSALVRNKMAQGWEGIIQKRLREVVEN